VNGSLVLLLSLVGVENLPAVQLVLEGCPQVRASELSRLLSLELGDGLWVQEVVGVPEAGPASLSVTLRCKSPKWEIDVDDAVTGKRLVRRLPAPTTAVERYAALSASQLIVASWMELLARQKTHDSRPTARVATQLAQKQVDLAHVPRRDAAPARWQLSPEVSGSGRLRQDNGGLIAGGGAIRVALTKGPFELGLVALVEMGAYQVPIGAVDARLVAAGVDGALRLFEAAPWFSVWLSLRVAGGSMRLAGRPLDPDLPKGEVIALQAETAVGVWPRFNIGAFSVRPRLELGVAFAAPRGVIPGGFVQPLGSFVLTGVGAGWTF
jgi:hypothetical protein